MTEAEFENLYWKQYIMLEKEFKASFKYVALDKSNFSTYSNVYAKLLLQIGSEVDIVAKVICKEIDADSNVDKITLYENEITEKFPEFTDVSVVCGETVFQPWVDWSIKSPEWWKIYNDVKHHRNEIGTHASETKENYKFANQGVILNSLAGLFQLEQYLYSIIPHNTQIETPLPGSRLFSLKGHGWEKKQFAQDSISYIDEDGHLYIIIASTSYLDI